MITKVVNSFWKGAPKMILLCQVVNFHIFKPNLILGLRAQQMWNSTNSYFKKCCLTRQKWLNMKVNVWLTHSAMLLGGVETGSMYARYVPVISVNVPCMYYVQPLNTYLIHKFIKFRGRLEAASECTNKPLSSACTWTLFHHPLLLGIHIQHTFTLKKCAQFQPYFNQARLQSGIWFLHSSGNADKASINN